MAEEVRHAQEALVGGGNGCEIDPADRRAAAVGREPPEDANAVVMCVEMGSSGATAVQGAFVNPVDPWVDLCRAFAF